MKPSELFCFKDTKNALGYYFSYRHAIKNSRRQMWQIWHRMEVIHQKIGWRRDKHGTVSQTRIWLVDSLICITCSLENNAFSVLRYVMVALHYSMLCQFEIFSAPGTIAHGSIRLPPREAARLQLLHIQTNINKRSCWFCKRLRLLYSFLRVVSDSY